MKLSLLGLLVSVQLLATIPAILAAYWFASAVARRSIALRELLLFVTYMSMVLAFYAAYFPWARAR